MGHIQEGGGGQLNIRLDRLLAAGQRMRLSGEQVGHRVPAADGVVADHRDTHGPDEQQHGLDAFRPNHGQQPADHRINSRQHPQRDDEEHQGIDAQDRVVVGNAEDKAQHRRRREQGDADMDHDRRN